MGSRLDSIAARNARVGSMGLNPRLIDIASTFPKVYKNFSPEVIRLGSAGLIMGEFYYVAIT